MAIKTILILLCFLFSEASYCASASISFLAPNDINFLPSKPADRKIPYGKDPRQFAELRLPSGHGPFPVVIILHGGCWRSALATIQNTEALADALRDSGYATWNIEYRSEDNEGGGWPGTFNDVAKAADLLRSISRQYHLDLKHVVAIGHSAGGHLALWLAARHSLPTTSLLYTPHPLVLRGVVTLGGIPDLQAFKENGESVCGGDVVGDLLGASPETLSARYQQASPKELLPLGVTQILVYGSEDSIAPAQLGDDYSQLAKTKGDTVKVIVVKDAGHFEYLAPNSVAWPIIKSAILSVIQ
jgi:acetyl esterase/lipase